MVAILKNNEKLTTFYFYSTFLKEVAREIKAEGGINFILVENGDNLIYDSNYKIEPTVIPMLLSLSEQLSKFFQKPINLSLHNNIASKDVLNFLYKCDFFSVAGKSSNSTFLKGRNILDFNVGMLGDLIQKDPRPEHKVRSYSLEDDDLKNKILIFENEDEKRDFLISEYVYIVRDHFKELLFDNSNTFEKVDDYIKLLSELITNGVLHSKSNTFALMFVNRFSTKFSISDNGIGFEKSLQSKTESFLYKPFELKDKIDKMRLVDVNSKILNNLHVIIETLYFSALKDRKGLFDLMISVVLDSGGYFRLHSDNSQIIVSNRMNKELNELNVLREKLFNYYTEILVNKITDKRYNEEMTKLKNEIFDCFVDLYKNLCDKYNNDFRYPSIRFYNVKFKGVHIEVEIPNA